MFGGVIVLLWAVFMLALIVLAVVGVVWLVRALGERSPGRSSALEELDVRYARGEIEREEYLQRRADLERR